MTHPALLERITRSLAYMLRHQPERFDLELDPYGWGRIEDVVRALIEKLGEPLDESDLREAIQSGDRPRYEIADDRVRALYGHSIDVLPGDPSTPPEFLYVGINSRDADRALQYGLRGGRRRFLHLARTVDEAREAGRRTGREYAVLTVFALDAWEEGINFYDRQALFLAQEIPTRFIEIQGSFHDGFERPESFEDGPRSGGGRGRREEHGRHRGGRRERGSRDDGEREAPRRTSEDGPAERPVEDEGPERDRAGREALREGGRERGRGAAREGDRARRPEARDLRSTADGSARREERPRSAGREWGAPSDHRERQERQDRPELGGHAGSADRARQGESTGRPRRFERGNRPDRPDRPDRSGRPDRPDRPDRSDRPDHFGRPDRGEAQRDEGHRERPEHAGRTSHRPQPGPAAATRSHAESDSFGSGVFEDSGRANPSRRAPERAAAPPAVPRVAPERLEPARDASDDPPFGAGV